MLNQTERQKRAQIILKRLNGLYPNPPIPLDHTDPFTMLVAVLLSAQCTDKRVNEITPALFRLARTPQKMAQQKVEDVLKIVRPCGLGPQKAKAIVGLSQILVEKYAGEVPQTLEELEELPGVGHKTAQVVVAQSFGTPAFPVDTHIHRLAKRWKLSSGKSVLQTERDLKALFAKEHWNKLHLQFIFYGREYCTARGCHEGRDEKSCDLCLLFAPSATKTSKRSPSSVKRRSPRAK
ncbi:MAG: endonuclease III [Bdellovibrionaceae bacterium]|nr:endonuclease III [Pseudobdellovibrionaceae bacterium]